MFGDIHGLPFRDNTFSLVYSQAVFEHVANPFGAADELIRVTKPGGIILTEVAFMQPLHAVPYHYFNMTPWGVEELFKSCEVIERDWFGDLSFTVDWLLKSVNLPSKVPAKRLQRLIREFKDLDKKVTHDELRPAASGIYVVVRKPTWTRVGARRCPERAIRAFAALAIPTAEAANCRSVGVGAGDAIVLVGCVSALGVRPSVSPSRTGTSDRTVRLGMRVARSREGPATACHCNHADGGEVLAVLLGRSLGLESMACSYGRSSDDSLGPVRDRHNQLLWKAPSPR